MHEKLIHKQLLEDTSFDSTTKLDGRMLKANRPCRHV